MKIKKSTSKRMPLGRKYKIEKRVSQHKKKMKKIARKSSFIKGKKGRTKELNIPNLWPFKEQMLNEMNDLKERIKQEREEKKKLIKEMKGNKSMMDVNETQNSNVSKLPTNLSDFVESALNRQNAFEASKSELEELNMKTLGDPASSDSSRKAFLRDLRKLIEESDVVLEILDARDPLGFRNVELERSIVAQGKKLVLILSKIDLVPGDVVKEWLTYLRREHPTLAFKSALNSSTEFGVNHSKSSGLNASHDFIKASSVAFGVSPLMSLIKNYSRYNKNSKKSITIGVMGYPNVGKSSLINSLKRGYCVKVGAVAGVTRHLQRIDLDSTTKLIDSPGVVFTGNSQDPSQVLRNTVQLTNVKDYFEPISLLLQKIDHEILLKLYKIPIFNNVSEFLTNVSISRGKLNKGGIPDINSAAMIVLTDWFNGKIPYYNFPPQDHSHQNQLEKESITIVSNWSQEFNIDSIYDELDSQIKS
ncbi:GTP binding/Guanine nucleotide-binding protein-like 3 N-terminal domain containing protein [Cryptosporidium tyzzeri]|nr:GTP binding/Guanine nucleotide-binding protein-like 3 N-terminal domain containing protein [Cryptosporidium tyzzeri]